jgi:hypothetical protein
VDGAGDLLDAVAWFEAVVGDAAVEVAVAAGFVVVVPVG